MLRNERLNIERDLPRSPASLRLSARMVAVTSVRAMPCSLPHFVSLCPRHDRQCLAKPWPFLTSGGLSLADVVRYFQPQIDEPDLRVSQLAGGSAIPSRKELSVFEP